MNNGYVRIGILVSIAWVIAIGAFVVMEGDKRNNFCAATPNVAGCRHIFWGWVSPDGMEDKQDATVDQAQEQLPDDGKASTLIGRKIAGAIAKQVMKIQGREFRPLPKRIAGVIIVPLALLWSLGFGIAWCVQGFKQQKK